MQIFERTNLRHLSTLPQLVDIATLDLSFISILTVTLCTLSFDAAISCSILCIAKSDFFLFSGDACSVRLDEGEFKLDYTNKTPV